MNVPDVPTKLMSDRNLHFERREGKLLCYSEGRVVSEAEFIGLLTELGDPKLVIEATALIERFKRRAPRG